MAGVILGVAREEMLHWALVDNLLTAVGSAAYASRPHLPHQARGYPAGVQLALVPFGEQGEGARGDYSSAHDGRFLAVYEEYTAMREADPSFEPAHPNVHAGVRPVDGHEPAVGITDPVTTDVTDLFDSVYDLTLQMIVRYFAFGEESDAELGVLSRTAVDLMYTAIKPLGLLLAELPVGPEHPGKTAGADFQLAYRSNFLLPHKRAAWIRFAERLDELAAYGDGIDAPADVRARLQPAVDGLRGALVELSPYLG